MCHSCITIATSCITSAINLSLMPLSWICYVHRPNACVQAWPPDVRNHPKWQDAGSKVGAVLLAALRNLSGFKDSQQQTEAILRVAACLSCLAPCCIESYPAVPVLPLGLVNDLKAALGAAQHLKPSPKVALTLSADCTVHCKAIVSKLEKGFGLTIAEAAHFLPLGLLHGLAGSAGLKFHRMIEALET